MGPEASIQLVLDLAGPVTTSVAVSPNPNNGTLGPDGYPGVVWVTATVTDAGPNPSAGSSRRRASSTPRARPPPAPGWTMMPVDGAFDQPVEQVYAQIPLSEIVKLSDGSHVFSVRGLDVAGNWGALATGTLQIDKTGPAITAAALSASSVHRPGTVQTSLPRQPTAPSSTASSTSSTRARPRA